MKSDLISLQPISMQLLLYIGSETRTVQGFPFEKVALKYHSNDSIIYNWASVASPPLSVQWPDFFYLLILYIIFNL